ncbi:dicarboxylate/amino acid:cation symporter [Tepidibacillus sp. LV47]|uniref:dicarboxylate/amino acid:cation symporter n=1 Tax=Tepidibacillus sp. LV47 TaxID=3398228 RepID=UPI003AAD3B7F
MKLTGKILLALGLGTLFGLGLNLFAPHVFPSVDQYLLTPLGKIFLNLINMLVVPIVFFSIALGTAGIGDLKKLGRIGSKTLIYFISTTAIAIIIGLALALTIQPGAGWQFSVEQANFKPKEVPPIMDTLLSIIPKNPIQSMANGDMLPLIFFSVFIGIGIAALGKKAQTFHAFVEQGNEIMMYLVTLMMKFAPYGTFGLIASAIGKQGFTAIRAMGLYMSVVILALFIHTIATYGSMILFIAKRNPIDFFKGFFPAMAVAFSTSSSGATLPVSMKTAQENLKVPEPISSFVQPLGATINMDGTAIMQGVATVFIAQVYGVDLTFSQIITVVLTATLASIGTASVPGVGLVMLTMVLKSVGLPVEGIGLILGVDRLLDMLRTAVNATGDAACAVVITKTEEKYHPEWNQEEESVPYRETEELIG